MKKTTFVLFVLTIILFSCSPSKKNASVSSNSFPTSIPKPGDDGLGYSTAIVITETSESKGVDAEYKWIKDHYTNYTIKMQSLNMHDNKPYDVITINQSSGEDLKLYFDISDYYGKF